MLVVSIVPGSTAIRVAAPGGAWVVGCPDGRLSIDGPSGVRFWVPCFSGAFVWVTIDGVGVKVYVARVGPSRARIGIEAPAEWRVERFDVEARAESA